MAALYLSAQRLTSEVLTVSAYMVEVMFLPPTETPSSGVSRMPRKSLPAALHGRPWSTRNRSRSSLNMPLLGGRVGRLFGLRVGRFVEQVIRGCAVLCRRLHRFGRRLGRLRLRRWFLRRRRHLGPHFLQLVQLARSDVILQRDDLATANHLAVSTDEREAGTNFVLLCHVVAFLE